MKFTNGTLKESYCTYTYKTHFACKSARKCYVNQ